MSLLAWRKIANQKEEVEKQIKNINNQIISSKLTDELGQIKFEKMFKPVTSRLDTQIEATKKFIYLRIRTKYRCLTIGHRSPT